MLYTTLILTYLATLSSNAMLSMLLLLVATYVTASLWLINSGIIYTGLLYVLVYVGAIVVLIMFVVQLTNTSLIADVHRISTVLLLLQNTVLIVCLLSLIFITYTTISTDLLINLSYLNLNETIMTSTNTNLVSKVWSNIDINTHGGNLSTLAYSIFNEYAYVLIISVHAIILAIIGPIKLAISQN